jgi:hypothetical protein
MRWSVTVTRRSFSTRPRVTRYRVRGVFAGDGDHLGATSSWNYFKFR